MSQDQDHLKNGKDTTPVRMDAKQVASERNALLIEALLDGELRPEEEEEVRRLMSSCDSLKRDYQFQKLVREEVQTWFENVLKEASGPINVWANIESRLLAESAKQLRWRIWWANALDYFRAPGPSRGAFAAVCAALLAMVLSSGVQPGKNPTNTLRLQPVSTAMVVSPNSTNSVTSVAGAPYMVTGTSQPVSFSTDPGIGGRTLTTPVSLEKGSTARVPSERIGAPIFFSRSADDSSRGFAFRFSLTSRRPGPGIASRSPSGQQLVAVRRVPQNERNFLRSGMRTSGADIDWIKSERAFRIVRPTEEKLPPVIWVAGRQPLD